MRTLIIGSGGIGAALVAEAGPETLSLSRRSDPPLDLTLESSIERAAQSLSGTAFDRIILATGILHAPGIAPEKAMRHLDPLKMAEVFRINAIGPALVMKHFLPRLPRDRRAVFAVLSARVGSIGDNQLGGWWSYRASKAALNQFLRTAAIEVARTHPQAIIVAIHPGTVATPLSAQFVKQGTAAQAPDEAARRILRVLDGLGPQATGGFFDHLGKAVPW